MPWIHTKKKRMKWKKMKLILVERKRKGKPASPTRIKMWTEARILTEKIWNLGGAAFLVSPSCSLFQFSTGRCFHSTTQLFPSSPCLAAPKPVLILHLPSLESFDPFPLSDLILSLHSLGGQVFGKDQEPLPISFIFGLSTSTKALNSILPWETLEKLEIDNMILPQADEIWQGLIFEVNSNSSQSPFLSIIVADSGSFLHTFLFLNSCSWTHSIH